jgi:hypothetical protein
MLSIYTPTDGQPLTNWANLRRKAHNGTYLWGSVERVTDDGGAWLKAFRAQAPFYGAEVVVTHGYVYVTFPEDFDE